MRMEHFVYIYFLYFSLDHPFHHLQSDGWWCSYTLNQWAPHCRSPADWSFTQAGLETPSLSLDKHWVRLISCFKPLQQSWVPGRRWEESGRGMGRRGPPSITPRPDSRRTATSSKHSAAGTGQRQKPTTPRWRSGQADRMEEMKKESKAEQGSRSSGFHAIRVWGDSLISPSNREREKWKWGLGWCRSRQREKEES